MESGVSSSVASAAAPRAASPLVIAIALVLLGHAALVLAGVFVAPGWVPIVECVAVCAIGLAHLRRVSEDPEPAATAAPGASAPVSSGPPAIPARIAPPIEAADRVAGA